MNPNTLTADGFFFALHLAESMGFAYDRAELLRRVQEAATGDVSVFASPQEELAKMERERGFPSTEEEKAEFTRQFAMRRTIDAEHAVIAARVVAQCKADGFL